MARPGWLPLGLALLAVSVASHAGAQPSPSEPTVARVVLPNGLVVLLSEDHTAPVVGFELRCPVGSRDDPPGRPGLSALTQRLMVHATRHVGPGQYERWLEGAGAESLVATTDDLSTWRVTVPADRLALPLWLWSDQMGFFIERLDEKVIAEQAAIVLNQHAQRVDSAPAGALSDFVDAALYPPDHPYHGGRLRASSDLAGVTAKEVQAFAEAHYRPDQAILALVGDFESARALSLVNQYFAPLATSGRAVRIAGRPPHLQGEKRIYVGAHIELPRVVIAWPTAPRDAADDAELDLVAEVLAGLRAGWLRWKLVDDLKIASQVSARQWSREYGSEFVIEAAATRGHSPEELLEAIDHVVVKLQAAEPAAESMQGATADYLVGGLFAMEPSAARAGRYAECEQFRLPVPCLEGWGTRYTAIQGKDLPAVAQRELPLTRRVVAEVFPADDAPIAGELRDVPPRNQ